MPPRPGDRFSGADAAKRPDDLSGDRSAQEFEDFQKMLCSEVDHSVVAVNKATAPPTPLDVLNEMNQAKKFCATSSCADADLGAWGRNEIKQLRASALATKSIFSYCFVAPMAGFQALYGMLMLIVTIVVQVYIPLIITITRQPILHIDEELHGSKACPNQADWQTKLVGLVLSLYFVTQVIGLCLNKLRGFGFLNAFVDLGFTRSLFIKLAMVCQFAGMAAVGGAQYMLFVGNADGAFVGLVLQSLAMMFCLTIDQNLVGNKIGTFTADRIAAISEGPLICGGLGIGEEGGGMPVDVFKKVKLLASSESLVLASVAVFGVGWSVAVAYCM